MKKAIILPALVAGMLLSAFGLMASVTPHNTANKKTVSRHHKKMPSPIYFEFTTTSGHTFVVKGGTTITGNITAFEWGCEGTYAVVTSGTATGTYNASGVITITVTVHPTGYSSEYFSGTPSVTTSSPIPIYCP